MKEDNIKLDLVLILWHVCEMLVCLLALTTLKI
jgi:hypothetical protein